MWVFRASLVGQISMRELQSEPACRKRGLCQQCGTGCGWSQLDPPMLPSYPWVCWNLQSLLLEVWFRCHDLRPLVLKERGPVCSLQMPVSQRHQLDWLNRRRLLASWGLLLVHVCLRLSSLWMMFLALVRLQPNVVDPVRLKGCL